ncbi:hypothetical protein BC826DRAFT_1137567, partial [Russula brevipes]
QQPSCVLASFPTSLHVQTSALAPPSTTPTPRLDHFIAYALHCTRLHNSVAFATLYLLQHLKAQAMIHILTSLCVSSVRACSHSGRSTRWNERCAPTWSGSSMSTHRHCATFNLVSSKISPDLDLDPIP